MGGSEMPSWPTSTSLSPPHSPWLPHLPAVNGVALGGGRASVPDGLPGGTTCATPHQIIPGNEWFANAVTIPGLVEIQSHRIRNSIAGS